MTNITDQPKESASPVFDGEDRECVRKILAGLGVRAHVLDGGLDFLLEEWGALVDRAEKGWTVDLYTFLSKLTIRTLIERVLDRVPPFLAQRMRRELAPLDHRWRAVPKVNEDFLMEPRLQGRYDPDRHFWLYGMPVTVRLE